MALLIYRVLLIRIPDQKSATLIEIRLFSLWYLLLFACHFVLLWWGVEK